VRRLIAFRNAWDRGLPHGKKDCTDRDGPNIRSLGIWDRAKDISCQSRRQCTMKSPGPRMTDAGTILYRRWGLYDCDARLMLALPLLKGSRDSPRHEVSDCMGPFSMESIVTSVAPVPDPAAASLA
jgi:hypothetical protein